MGYVGFNSGKHFWKFQIHGELLMVLSLVEEAVIVICCSHEIASGYGILERSNIKRHIMVKKLHVQVATLLNSA